MSDAARPFAVRAAAAAALLVAATRWPFRSRVLFSWDSANFALAMARIDIRAHRPHPPGYLGYVIAGRALNTVTHDPNAALVLWNLIAAAAAIALLAVFAWQLERSENGGSLFAVAAALVVATSPLFWFYNEVAEIYSSELLVSLAIAYAAWRARLGTRGALYACACALALAAVFKLTAALLMLPLAAYAFSGGPPAERRRSLLLLAGLAVTVAIGFLVIQPDLPAVVWTQFAGSTSGSRLVSGNARAMVALNRNLRDTAVAAATALGVVNILGLLAWAVGDRRLPPALNRRFVILWIAPWIVLFVAIHLAKPGYILPLLPVAGLITAAFYVRQRRAVAVSLVALQAAVNVAYFTQARPFSDAQTGGMAPYRSKTVLQRAASDLQGVTFPTARTIRTSDDDVLRFLDLVRRSCPAADPVVIVGTGAIDWRRAMWYLPSATAIDQDGDRVLYIARQTDFASVPADGVTVQTACPVIWIADDAHAASLRSRTDALEVEPGIGWLTRPGRLRVTPGGVTFGR